MVEPISLSLGAIIAALVAKASERATDEAVEAGEGVLQRLVTTVRKRFSRREDEAVGTAWARVEEVPDSSSRQGELAALLDQRAEADADVRRELEQLRAEVRSAGVVVSQTAIGDQNVQVAGNPSTSASVSYGAPRQ